MATKKKTTQGQRYAFSDNSGPISTEKAIDKIPSEVASSVITRNPRGQSRLVSTVGNDEGEFKEDEPEIIKRGPKPQINDEWTSEFRDSLIQFIEPNWPPLREILNGTPSTLRETLLREFCEGFRSYDTSPHIAKFAKEALEAWDDKKRIANDPRNLANALAGLPYVAWRTSLNRMSKCPYTGYFIHDRAVPDFFRRNYPIRYAQLRDAKTVKEVKHILSLTRSQDPDYLFCKRYPESVLMAFAEVPRH